MSFHRMMLHSRWSNNNNNNTEREWWRWSDDTNKRKGLGFIRGLDLGSSADCFSASLNSVCHWFLRKPKRSVTSSELPCDPALRWPVPSPSFTSRYLAVRTSSIEGRRTQQKRVALVRGVVGWWWSVCWSMHHRDCRLSAGFWMALVLLGSGGCFVHWWPVELMKQ